MADASETRRDARLRPDDLISTMRPPSLLNVTVARLARDMGVRTIADLAVFDLTRAYEVQGVGRIKVAGLEKLQERARKICISLLSEAAQARSGAALELQGASEPAREQVETSRAASWATQATWEPGPLDELLLAAHLFHGATTLEDFLALDLGRMVSLSGRTSAVRAAEIRALRPALFEGLEPMEVVQEALASLDERSRDIVLRTELAPPENRETLAHIGTGHGVSRERVRQLEVQALEQFDEQTAPMLPLLGRALVSRAGYICRSTTAEALLEPLLQTPDIDLRRTTLRALLRAAGYKLSRGNWLIHRRAKAEPARIKEAFEQASNARAVVPHEVIEAHCAPLLEAEERDAYLEQEIGLARFHGHWIRSRTGRWRALAALALHGKPATKEEIATIAGLQPRYVPMYLGTFEQVCRADKVRFAFKDWGVGLDGSEITPAPGRAHARVEERGLLQE